MKTELTLLDHSYELLRYPAENQHVSWQAWDSADEYLMEYVAQNITDLNGLNIQIYNDDFGALGVWFATNNAPLWISDSFVAHKALALNLERNHLPIDSVNAQNSLYKVNKKADLVLIKVPKTLALLEQQLIDLQSSVTLETRVIAAGKANAIQKSTLALFEKHLGVTTTSLAKKKSRLIFCQYDGVKQSVSPYPTKWKTDNTLFTISNLANVFSRQQLDIGARVLLAHLPDANHKRIVDLGCGNGVLGLHVLHKSPDAHVIFVDESFMAIASAKMNIEQNMPDKLGQCEFIVSNCLEEYLSSGENEATVDIVLCNPPFHQQNTITDHIALQMFKDSKRILKHAGELRVVGNRHLDYPQTIKRLFGHYKVLASDRKFSILSAIKK
ncbi:methyltransferase [Paraglaciecola mesophila]|uniref:Ribosomal RNA large subunit methyltransferase G n=1 Tax=Paraglaciecola mesophila TaxID=197222 RepID=A0ABU9SYZ4_9ALTE